MGLLDGKVAIITGAGNGIGLATARLFAQEGASLVINDTGTDRHGESSDSSVAQKAAEELSKLGVQTLADDHDIGTEAGAEQLVEAASERFGHIDILINNAGILRDKTLLKMDLDMWNEVLRVHLSGTFLCTRAAARVMKRQNSGRIVNTTSISGLIGSFGQANYAAAKAGIYGLTRTASMELQRYGIAVNAVAPLAKTRMTEDLPLFEKIDDSMSAEHVAPAHLFLASDLSERRTGVVLGVAGGKLSVFRLVENAGTFKEAERGIWSAEEIAEHWQAIAKGSH